MHVFRKMSTKLNFKKKYLYKKISLKLCSKNTCQKMFAILEDFQ